MIVEMGSMRLPGKCSKMKVSLKVRWALVATAFASGYVSVFIVASAAGDYSGTLASGRLKYEGGIGLSDTMVWQPAGLYVLPNGPGNARTTLFWPLILVDRAWYHPDKSVNEIDWNNN